MKRFLFTVLLLVTGVYMYSQPNLAISEIPDSLKENANAVIRYHETYYERTSTGKYIEKIHYAVTILNKLGDGNARLIINYDDIDVPGKIEGNLYNSSGKLISKLKKKDINDFSNYADFVFFSGNRVKYASPAINNYPYTIEYNYEITHSGIVGFTTWMPLDAYHLAVQQATMTFMSKEELLPRYRELNCSFHAVRKVGEAGKTILKWSMPASKALLAEKFHPPYTSIFPMVFLSPNEFKYDGSEGSMINWNEYGKWVYSLIEDRDALPEATLSKIQNLVGDLDDTVEIVRKIYHYMQSKTRYVAIMLGIGGFQPMLAADVDRTGYGDCKALSNYTRSLLKAAGIKSYYSEIGSGFSQQIRFTDFSSVNQTNHVILCVPLQKDTIWLECTNQHYPFGYIGKDNSNRYALLIKPSGGELARTPVYSSENNSQNVSTTISVNPDNSITANMKINCKGAEFQKIFVFDYLSEKEQREALLKMNPVDGMKLLNHSFAAVKKKNPEGTLNISLSSQHFMTKAGTRLFLKLAYFKKFENLFPKDDVRRNDIYIESGYTHTDSILYKIPDGMVPEYIPEKVKYNSIIGNYQTNYKLEGNNILFIRTLEIKQGLYSKDDYETLRKFCLDAEGAENRKIILKKTTI